MTVTKLYNTNESVELSPHKYIKTLTADSNPTGVPAGSELWDAQADLTYVTNDGSTWYQKKRAAYEKISYVPNLRDSGDLESATKTITRTAEASGTGNADYSSALVIPIPTDARLAIMRIAHRISVTIDSDDGTHDLRCRVYIDAQDTDHLMHDLTFSTTGNQLAVQDCVTGTKDILFNLLKDGASHAAYIFFWTPGNHAPVISVVNTWRAVGTTGSAEREYLRLTHCGLFNIIGWYSAMTGTKTGHYTDIDSTASAGANFLDSENHLFMTKSGIKFLCGSNSATDLTYLRDVLLVLRSE